MEAKEGSFSSTEENDPPNVSAMEWLWKIFIGDGRLRVGGVVRQSGGSRHGWCLLFCLLFARLVSSAASGPSVVVSWDANTSCGIVGYILYYGTASGVYTCATNNALRTTVTISNLLAGTTYYFVVTDYNTAGQESLPSSEISYTVTNSPRVNPVITWLYPDDIVYGTALDVDQLSATADVPGSFAYTPPLGTVLAAGNAQTLSATFLPVDLTNYYAVAAAVTVNILPAPLTITPDNNNKVYGADLPVLTASYDGFVNGDTAANLSPGVTLAATALASSPVGVYPITASGAASTNYSITEVNGTLTITPSLSTGLMVSSANPSLPGTNVTFTMSLGAAAPGAGVPSGTVNFVIDGNAAASVTLSYGVAALTMNNLAPGSHSVAAEYPGDLNFVGTTNAQAQPQVIATLLAAGGFTLQRYPTQGVKVPVATLLANDTGLDITDSNALMFISVSAASAAGGTNVLAGDWVFYEPPAGFTNSDSFSYVVGDCGGLQATGSVSVVTGADLNPSQNIVDVVDLGGGGFKIRFLGIPARVYTIQSTSNLATPCWQSLGTETADATGSFYYIDLSDQDSPPRFYRSTYP